MSESERESEIDAAEEADGTEETEDANLAEEGAGGGAARWFRGAILVVLAAAIVAVIVGPTEAWLEEVVRWIEDLGPVGGVVFAAVYVAATVLFVPGSILTVGAGFIFGLLWGSIIISVAATTGALAAFFVGRYLARDWVRSKVRERPRFDALYRAIEKDAFKVVLLTRLVPLFPFNLLNYAFGITDVSWKKYLLGSWLGMIPGTIAYVYAGAAASSLVKALAVEEPPGWTTYALWGLGAVAVVVGSVLITRRAKGELEELIAEEEIEEEVAAEEFSA